MIQKKVCMLGAHGVGKTSLVMRFVHSRFSEQYLSTMGVKVDRKVVDAGTRKVNMMLWDIHGEEESRKVAGNYMRGTAGAMLVADGTRIETLDAANVLLARLRNTVGDVPWVLMVNKHDLVDEWALSSSRTAQLERKTQNMHLSSAKTGEHVETAFYQLAMMMVKSQ